jgi:tRNA-specific 2-thiouridylase
VGPDRVRIRFDSPQRALAPGQICAFYDGSELIGGGIFESVTPDIPG